jgi:SAM-dependent methyltransferase
MATKKKTNKTESDWNLSSGTAKDIEASESAPSSQVEIFDDVQTESAQAEVVLKETVLAGETVYDADLAEEKPTKPLGNAIVYVDIEIPPAPTKEEIEQLIEADGRDEGEIVFPTGMRVEFSRKPNFIYNRLASLEGYRGFGVSYRKDWEIEMALKTLHDLGGAHPNANILGVGAGTERTIFELANAQSAALVTPTDIYLTPGVWADWHGEKFMKNPHAFAPAGLTYDPARIIPMHVDMCDMPYDDDVYDGIFSSGSIEHVGYPKAANWELVAKAAKEIGRVLKKGGIASISTEFKVSGEGWGFEGVRLFSKEDILKYIVEPSGLELVGEVDWEYHGDLSDFVELADAVRNPQAEENKPLLRHDGFLFTSIHLALQKKLK